MQQELLHLTYNEFNELESYEFELPQDTVIEGIFEPEDDEKQMAIRKLNFTLKRTMSVAQGLYEGVKLPQGHTGLITYMRTDSTRLSNEFIASTYKFIEDKYGSNYVGHVKVSKKTENVQDAHEAIRPTSINRTPESVKEYLSNDEYKLYSLIYYRALASLMADAKVLGTTVILDNNNYNSHNIYQGHHCLPRHLVQQATA